MYFWRCPEYFWYFDILTEFLAVKGGLIQVMMLIRWRRCSSRPVSFSTPTAKTFGMVQSRAKICNFIRGIRTRVWCQEVSTSVWQLGRGLNSSLSINNNYQLKPLPMGREIDIDICPAAATFPWHEEIIFIYTLTCRGGKLEAELQVKAGTKVSCSQGPGCCTLCSLHTHIDWCSCNHQGTRKHLLFTVR